LWNILKKESKGRPGRPLAERIKEAREKGEAVS